MSKSAVKKNTAKTASKFARGEYIRVVPLHQPKPSVAIDELKELAAKAPTPKLVYGGGALLQNVQVYTVFWGKT